MNHSNRNYYILLNNKIFPAVSALLIVEIDDGPDIVGVMKKVSECRLDYDDESKLQFGRSLEQCL